MKIAKWFGFGRDLNSKRRRVKPRLTRRPVVEGLEDRSLLAVLVGTPAGSCGAPDWNSVQDAMTNSTGTTLIRICGETYYGDIASGLDATDADFLSPEGPSSQTGQVVINGNLTLKGNPQDQIIANINGNTPGSSYDQFVINGSVILGVGDNHPKLAVTGTRTAGNGQAIVLIQNDGTDAIDGIFADNQTATPLNEGSPVVVNGVLYFISYKYNSEAGQRDTGNDVALIEPTPNSAEFITDPLNGNSDPSNQAIYVFGSNANNTIAVQQSSNTQIVVSIDGVNKLTVDTTQFNVTHLVIYGLDGNDNITVDPNVDVPALIFGGAGDDTLQSGKGRSVLVGGGGNDTMQGRTGEDILIGGQGSDSLTGGGGDDILVGSSTQYDDNVAQLAFLLTQTVSDAQSEFMGKVASDLVQDTLIGNGGQDFYFASSEDKVQLTKQDSEVLV